MANKFLDYDGLLYFWQKLKALLANKSDTGHTHTVKELTDTTDYVRMTATERTKLSGIQTGADAVSFTQTATSGNEVGTITINGTGTKMYAPTQTTVSGNAGSATQLATARTIDGVSFNGTAAITHFGTCSTAADTVAKTVSLTGFSLVTGARIAVKFTNGNTAASPTLSVNSTTAKAMKYGGNALGRTTKLSAGRTYEFIYDGTSYELVGELDTTADTSEFMDNTSYDLELAENKQRVVTNASRLIDIDKVGDFSDVGEEEGFDVGSATQPVYFENGIPKAANAYTTYTLSSFGVTATAAELNKLDGVTATATELNYVDGVTSNIQTQLNGKATKSTTLAGYGITNAYTSTQVDTKIAEAIAGAGHIKRTVVTTLPTTPEANVIYMLKDTTVSEGDVYLDYMLIDGSLVMVGDTSAEFTTITNGEIDTILAA